MFASVIQQKEMVAGQNILQTKHPHFFNRMDKI